jgi:3-methyladenine DNA glycosylase AlkD
MYLSYYLKDQYIKEVLRITDEIKSDYYYVKMGKAWLISIAYIKYPELTLEYLKKSQLDNWTFNKSIQKIKESFRVSKIDKDMLNKLKR